MGLGLMANMLSMPPSKAVAALTPKEGGVMPAPPPVKPNALATNAMGNTAMTPQQSPYAAAMAPKPKQNALLGSALDGFMRGFRPQQWQADQDKQKMDGAERAKQTLALMQQQRQIPAEQRAQWWQQNADQIGQIVGADVKSLPMDANSFTDQALDGQIAMMSAKLGIAPATPEAARYQGMGLGDGGVGVLNQTTGKMEVVREPTAAAPKPVQKEYDYKEVGNRVIAINKNDPSDRMDVGPAKPAGSGGDGLTTWQQLQYERQLAADAQKTKDADLALNAAVTNLKDGQQRVTDLINSKGFDGIYGPFGAFGINAGAKPTNVMSQDELNAMAMLDQVGGEAFLAGVQKMRGTGPLSDNEGKRVSAAVTRLTNRMQSPKAAKEAAIEFRDAMQALERAYAKESGGAPSPIDQTPAPQPTGAQPSFFTKSFQNATAGLQVPQGIDPADWDFMTDEQKALFQ